MLGLCKIFYSGVVFCLEEQVLTDFFHNAKIAVQPGLGPTNVSLKGIKYKELVLLRE